jgi:hypothetical protein
MVEVIHALNQLTWPGAAGLLIGGVVLVCVVWAAVILIKS